MSTTGGDDRSDTTADRSPAPAQPSSESTFQAHPSLAQGVRLAGRYRLVRILGQGAMGTVYAAIDEQRSGLRVALKLLVERQPSALYRLKNEFRALAETVHPNLVGLHGLGSDERGWFVVMDLIDPSSDFRSYVRGGEEDRLDEGRLRAALVQLLRGVSAIHAAGKLHRDLKPHNVLVSNDGRVVIVDFGVVGDLGQREVRSSLAGLFAGTPAYAAPEQMLGETLGPKADLYSVGVMLYEALSGELPSAGSSRGDLLRHKLDAQVRAPSALSPSVPADLDELCTALLQPDPGLRPDAQQVLAWLGERAQLPPEAASSLPFVARGDELRVMREAQTRVKDGPRVVVLSGPSGIGKTALTAHFVERLAREQSALSMRGRCHPHEQLPFKAFDTLVDELGQHLMRLPSSVAESLIPRDIAPLSRLFHTLSRVPAIGMTPPGRDQSSDQVLLRSRAFAALKELLAHIAERQPLVLIFDDLQWSDRDSAELLRELLRPPQAPACLFVCVFRESQAGDSPLAEALRALSVSSSLTLQPLDERSSADLARSLLGDAWSPLDLRVIVNDAAGSPFLLKELSRHARASGQVSELRAAVGARIMQLDPDARRLLELVCIAGQPLELDIALRASKVEPQALPAVLASLLLRTTLQHGREHLEGHHDKIREAVVAALPSEQRAGLHAELAHEFARSPAADANLIARHYHAAGQPLLAAKYAVVAAAQATHALAFGHAAELYALAIQHADPADKPALEVELANTYTSLGRLRDAAELYERTLEASASPQQRRELASKAMVLHLLQGNIQRGLRLLEGLCRQLGLRPLPRRPWLAKLAIALLFLRYILGRRVASLPVPSESRHTPISRERLALSMRAARGFGHWSFEHGAYFCLQAVLIIRKRRDRAHWPFALAGEAVLGSFRGTSTARDEQKMANALALAESQGDAELFALILAGAGGRSTYAGQFARAEECYERAEQVLSGRSVAPVFNGVRSGLYAVWITTGHLDQVLARSDAWLAEARALGDRWGEQISQLMGSYRFLALDQPEAMRDAVEHLVSTAGRESPPFGAHPLWLVEPALYLDRPEEALEAYLAARRKPTFAALQIFAFDRVGCSALLIRAYLAVAARDPTQRAACLRIVERESRRLDRERFVTAPAVAAQARAGLAMQRGDAPRALLELERAAQSYAQSGLALYAAAARERIGKLRAGQRGAEGVAEARSAAIALGVRNPERMFRALVTGFHE